MLLKTQDPEPFEPPLRWPDDSQAESARKPPTSALERLWARWLEPSDAALVLRYVAFKGFLDRF